MKAQAALVSLFLFLGNGAEAKDDDPPRKPSPAVEELQRFQGTWHVEVWEEAGKALGAADLKKRAVFFGANVFVFLRDGKVFQAGSTQLDPGKSPRTVNFSVKDGEGKDGVMLGIYSLEADTLKFCLDSQGQTRPKDFKPKTDSGFTMMTLKKPRPDPKESVDIVGKYRSELTEANGKLLVTEALIEKHGDAYTLTYTLGDKTLFVGTGIRKGEQLSIGWVSAGQAGVSVYKIETGPKLVGEYTNLGGIGLKGKEVLTPWKKIE